MNGPHRRGPEEIPSMRRNCRASPASDGTFACPSTGLVALREPCLSAIEASRPRDSTRISVRDALARAEQAVPRSSACLLVRSLIEAGLARASESPTVAAVLSA
jgi:hypothetical protein